MKKRPDTIHIVAMRFSAMGDVAMCVPVVREFLEQNPEVNLIFVSRPLFAPLFEGIPRLEFYPADLKGKHKGVAGLWRLSRELCRSYRPQIVLDMHNVLRTQMISFFMRLSGKKVYTMRKGRAQKKKLVAGSSEHKKQLPLTVERYADVLQRAGFSLSLSHRLRKKAVSLPEKVLALTGAKAEKWIGIAPFAQYAQKTYPQQQMLSLIESLGEDNGVKILLFGGGKKEVEILTQWEKQMPGVVSVAGKFSLGEELALISNLDLMVSMDSANMHLASLVGTRVVSLWGATHPYAGFLGYGQQMDDALFASLPCCPCSVFGNKPCTKDTLECFAQTSAQKVSVAIKKALS